MSPSTFVSLAQHHQTYIYNVRTIYVSFNFPIATFKKSKLKGEMNLNTIYYLTQHIQHISLCIQYKNY